MAGRSWFDASRVHKEMTNPEQSFAKLNVVILGLPGSGKTTLINSLSPKPNYVSLGDITRQELTQDTHLAERIRAQFTHNDPWPPEFVLEIVAPSIMESRDTGFVLDGVPRQRNEAIELIHWFATNNVRLDLVLALKIGEQVAFDRRNVPERKNRPETREQFASRVRTYLQDEDEMFALLGRMAGREIIIDVNRISIEEVRRQFVTSLQHQFG